MTPAQIFLFKTTSADNVLAIGDDFSKNAEIQIDDAISYANMYPGSRQLIVHENYNLLSVRMHGITDKLTDKAIIDFNYRRIKFDNGSEIKFDTKDTNDLTWYWRYGGAEFNVVRFIEVACFRKIEVLYLRCRIRGRDNNYPLRLKLTSTHYKRQKDFIKDMFFEAFQNPNIPTSKIIGNFFGKICTEKSIVIVTKKGELLEV
jgi:hypothetical protein